MIRIVQIDINIFPANTLVHPCKWTVSIFFLLYLQVCMSRNMRSRSLVRYRGHHYSFPLSCWFLPVGWQRATTGAALLSLRRLRLRLRPSPSVRGRRIFHSRGAEPSQGRVQVQVSWTPARTVLHLPAFLWKIPSSFVCKWGFLDNWKATFNIFLVAFSFASYFCVNPSPLIKNMQGFYSVKKQAVRNSQFCWIFFWWLTYQNIPSNNFIHCCAVQYSTFLFFLFPSFSCAERWQLSKKPPPNVARKEPSAEKKHYFARVDVQT